MSPRIRRTGSGNSFTSVGAANDLLALGQLRLLVEVDDLQAIASARYSSQMRLRFSTARVECGLRR
jgi:hypothetical protein